MNMSLALVFIQLAIIGEIELFEGEGGGVMKFYNVHFFLLQMILTT